MTSENLESNAMGESNDATDATVTEVETHDVPVLSDEVIEERRLALVDVIDMLRPAVQIDGGDLELIEADYVNGIVEVELQGACGSCAVSSVTLTAGVERILKERLDWVTEVVGGVDEEMDQLESAALGRGAYVPKYY